MEDGRRKMEAKEKMPGPGGGSLAVGV